MNVVVKSLREAVDWLVTQGELCLAFMVAVFRV